MSDDCRAPGSTSILANLWAWIVTVSFLVADWLIW